MNEIFPLYSIGHFINEPDNPTQFEILRFEDMNEPEVEDPHKHTFYEIIWIDEGKSTQVIDYNEYNILPGNLFFISPGQLHHFGKWRQLKGGSLLFTEDFYLLNYQNKEKLFELTFLDNFYSNPSLRLNKKCFKEIKLIIDLILKEKRRKDYSDTILQSLLHLLLVQIQREVNVSESGLASKKYIILYKKLKTLVDFHFVENLSVKDYASKLSVTSHHLNFAVKQITGKSAGDAIRARSILEAKRLLTFTDQTISEISFQLGFTDSSYFARFFRSETGKSPSEFRKHYPKSTG